MSDRLRRRLGGNLRTIIRLQFAILAMAMLSSCLFAGGDVDDDDNLNAGTPDQGQTNGKEDCEFYCEFMLRSCPATFADEGACVQQCERYPRVPETDDDVVVPLGDRVDDRNSLECRTYHAGLADRSGVLDGNHCGHAGPDGDDTCVDSPLCSEFCFGEGSPEEDFDGFVEVCGGTAAALDASECLQLCSGLAEGTRGDETGDTVHCRLTYAIQAQQAPELCISAGRNSVTCNSLTP